ncbi:tyrosine-type recombinase/integrase [Streptomyces thinghirensis]|uniref:tyrosine-type recombinase/integrase n=1 Tax=Streptomyces thinghirensis TaxID=551547 RepID=UPI0031E7B4FE
MDASWRPACAQAGIAKGTGPHALRHHYASLLIKHGESVKTVSERLGHTNAAMTLKSTPTCGPTPRSGPGPPSTRRTRTSPPMPGRRSTKRRSRSSACRTHPACCGLCADRKGRPTRSVAGQTAFRRTCQTLKRNSTTSPSCIT